MRTIEIDFEYGFYENCREQQHSKHTITGAFVVWDLCTTDLVVYIFRERQSSSSAESILPGIVGCRQGGPEVVACNVPFHGDLRVVGPHTECH